MNIRLLYVKYLQKIFGAGSIKVTLKGIIEYYVILLVLIVWIAEQYIGTFNNCLSVWYISYEASQS